MTTHGTNGCLIDIVQSEALQRFTTQSRLLIPLEKKAFENIEGKGENAGNQHFLLCPKCFFTLSQHIFQLLRQNYFVVWKCFEFGLV